MWLYLCSFLLSSTHAYDYLAHTALQKVPAKIGQDTVQLRCTKIIERIESDYIEVPSSCLPSWDDKSSCYHAWSKDGTLLSGDMKYDMKSVITFDYCENFEWTTDLIKSFGPIVEVNEIGYYGSKEMSCYSSALTIRNVQKTDFGEYKCNFSDHKDWKANLYNGHSKDSNIQNITLYNINDTAVQQPTSVEYFEDYFTKGLKDTILMQCVVTGGPLNWYFSVPYVHVNDTIFNLGKLNSIDLWRCFNVSEQRHSPHKDITESFVYVNGICGLDSVTVWCGVGDVRSSNTAYITKKVEWYYDYDYSYYNYRAHVIIVSCFTVFPIVAFFMIIASIVACVRSKMCGSCKSRTTPVLHYQPPIGTPLPVPQPAVYYTSPYNTTPVQNNRPPLPGYSPA